jgi:nifR3 family TIM-barrel protein
MKSIIGLSPMDGVTDAAFRYIVDQYGRPDILYTEFVPVTGILLEKPAISRLLLKHKTQTPQIAQLFGNDPELFSQATEKIIKLGFNGVDINMGCPDNNVTKRGGGAGLIKTPHLAIKIIQSVRATIIRIIGTGEKFTLSVKTRTGIKKHETREWISRLLETEPDFICLHGRTVTQGYRGRADWEEIGLAAELAQKTKTKILGNGDIESRSQALEKIKKYKLEGVLIGRAALGNPWVFQGKTPVVNERLQVMLEHCQKFIEFFPQGNFKAMRKHLIWYAKGFRNSTKVRKELMRVNNLNDVVNIIKNI